MKKKSKNRMISPNSIDEKSFVNINGQNQYVFIRGNIKPTPFECGMVPVDLDVTPIILKPTRRVFPIPIRVLLDMLQ